MQNNYTPSPERYNSMIYNRVGKSGLKLPAVSLGLWHNFGTNDNFTNMVEMCTTAFDLGITHFDLANNYGPVYGAAETNFGKILKTTFAGLRDELVISTKAGYDMWPGPYGDFGSRKYLIASLDQSLKRLGLEYVDIFYHHRMDSETPLEETMLALDQIVRSGKALYVGISNYDGATFARATSILQQLNTPFIINQNRFSIFDRTIEHNGLKDTARKLGKGIIAFSPLAQGLLTERYLNGIPNDSRAVKSGVFLKREDITQNVLAKIQALNAIAQGHGCTLSQMALKWILKDSDLTSVLIGASKPSQIAENAKIIDIAPLSKEELEAIDKIVMQ